MASRSFSRRRVVQAGIGIGTAIAVARTPVRPAMADEPGAAAGSGLQSPRHRPVSMALHTHSCFSEGGSYAAGGGGASMLAQLEQASRSNVDVVWWTDHDWRMEAYGYYDGIAFDGTDENGDLEWFVQNEGTVADDTHEFVDDPHSPDEPGRALRVTATGPADEWGSSYLWGKPGNSFYSTNVSDTTLRIDVLGEQIGTDAELVVQVETSYRPAIAGRPAGVYVLEYRVGAAASRQLDAPLVGAVTVAFRAGWQTLTLHLLDDVKAFWPDLVAEDSGLARLRFGVRARHGTTASGVFDNLRFTRTRDPLRWPVETQRALMRRLQNAYPNITQLLSTEVSMVRHMNVFMENFELYPYPPRGKAPVLDNSVEAAESIVAWYHDRGALVQYNHPPTDTAELVQTRALGTDLIEVANADGDFTVLHDRINLYDVAARNAIFLTATSQIDDHAGRNWPGKSHLYITSVWSTSTSAGDLITALGSGDAWWFHQGLWPDGTMDLTVDGRRAMGRVIPTRATSIRVAVSAGSLPSGATVQIIVGVCDRMGATAPSTTRSSYSSDAFRDGPMSFLLEQQNGSYLRVEVYDSAGVLVGFGNPLWMLPVDAGIDIPHLRRLTP